MMLIRMAALAILCAVLVIGNCSANEKPHIIGLFADKQSPQNAGSIITWTAEAYDSENDPLLYRFFLNGQPITDWTTGNQWTWTASTSDLGENQVEVRIIDGKHASQYDQEYSFGGHDETYMALFVISEPTGMSASDEATTSDSSVVSAKLAPGNVYSLEPYNVSFNFSGLNDYRVVKREGLDRIESSISMGTAILRLSKSPYERYSQGWNQLDNDMRGNIEIIIKKYNMVNPNAIVTKAQHYETARMFAAYTGATIINANQFNGRTWYSYQERNDIDRPIPTNKVRFETDLVEHYEDMEVTFEYVPDSVIEEFLNSFNITGYGTPIVEESWDQYVARVRKPSEQYPEISALEFIDRCFTSAGIRYDANTGDLYEIWKTSEKDEIRILTKKDVEERAILSHYYGPIPLPKNVSIDRPNGE